MQIQVNKADKVTAMAMIDSLELAIEILEEMQNNDTLHALYVGSITNRLDGLRTSIQDLQMLRVAYMLVARTANTL